MTNRAAGTADRTEREKRLAEALKANLRRRKDQARSRRAGDPDPREGLQVGEAGDATTRSPESEG